MITNKLKLIKNCCAFHTTSILGGNGSKTMWKIMGGSKKKKFHYPDTPILPSPTANIFGRTPFETKVMGNPRRSAALDKLFMRHITDLMATGEYSNQIVGYGIEINKVKITADRRILRVYWIANKSANYKDIESVLTRNAGLLRKELSDLRILGEVPNIVFVKDKTYSKIAEVEQKLAVADFGEDHEDTESGESLTSDYEILASLNNIVKANTEKLDLKSDEKQDVLSDIPPMPQNVLGLDHAGILNRIKKTMSASEAVHRKNPSEVSEWSKWSQFKMSQSINTNPVSYASQQEQRQAFKEFWQQRQILKMKQNRVKKNWSPDIEILKEELRERHLKSIGGNDFERQEDDYIVEGFEENQKS